MPIYIEKKYNNNYFMQKNISFNLSITFLTFLKKEKYTLLKIYKIHIFYSFFLLIITIKAKMIYTIISINIAKTIPTAKLSSIHTKIIAKNQ